MALVNRSNWAPRAGLGLCAFWGILIRRVSHPMTAMPDCRYIPPKNNELDVKWYTQAAAFALKARLANQATLRPIEFPLAG